MHRPDLVPLIAVLSLLLPACGVAGIGDPSDPGESLRAKADDPGATPEEPPRDILEQLREVPGLTAKEVSSFYGRRAFTLELDQPADHASPGGARFKQRLHLLHRSQSAPMVVYSSGYHLDDRNLHEPASVLDANQLSVEHRFFGPSIPEPADWSKDTIVQSAADYHRIIEALKPIYRGRWITTGISKGGMTSIYHRRFYPADVDGTVAYVAPQSFGIADPRYVEFVENVGNASCRKELSDFQRLVLTRREAMVAALQHLEAASNGQTSFSILGHDRALEHAVVDFPFTYWQYTGVSTCGHIPDEKTNDSLVFWFLQSIGFLEWYEDAKIKDYQGYNYQAYTQLGTPANKESHLADLLKHPGSILPSTYCLVCQGAPFDKQAMPDIDAWVRSQGDRLMFIYGANDPWTAGAFQLGNATDSFRYLVEDGTHSASIADLPEAERDAAIATLARWAGKQKQLAPAGEPGVEGEAGTGSQLRLAPRIEVGALRLQQRHLSLTGLSRPRL